MPVKDLKPWAEEAAKAKKKRQEGTSLAVSD